jgi:hypothetical protein
MFYVTHVVCDSPFASDRGSSDEQDGTRSTIYYGTKVEIHDGSHVTIYDGENHVHACMTGQVFVMNAAGKTIQTIDLRHKKVTVMAVGASTQAG